MENITKSELTAEQWLLILENAEIESDTTFINDQEVFVDQDSYSYSTDLTQTITIIGTNLRFVRHGYKVIEYDRWVDSNWFNWDLG